MSKRGDIIEKVTDLERIMNERILQKFYANKLDHLDEMNKFLRKHYLPKLT